jgi:hypothetical protein
LLKKLFKFSSLCTYTYQRNNYRNIYPPPSKSVEVPDKNINDPKGNLKSKEFLAGAVL